jgi:hypothetical protein
MPFYECLSHIFDILISSPLQLFYVVKVMCHICGYKCDLFSPLIKLDFHNPMTLKG